MKIAYNKYMNGEITAKASVEINPKPDGVMIKKELLRK